VLDAFRQRALSTAEAAEQLGLSHSRLYALSTEYLGARAQRQGSHWVPGSSGGDHAAPWPQPVVDLLHKRLSSSPPCPYSFAASEALRLHAFKLDRAQVRRWAIENHLAHPVPAKRVLAPVRRWQRARIGELWQLDASPHRWFPSVNFAFPMLNMLDDCSRLFTGSKLYERELLLAYFDFLPAAFLAHGRPLQLYVDYHSLFFTQDPDALTQLGWALKFYDISLRYAPTPQAKGKIEREHQFWQGRLPAYFASEKIDEIHVANPHIDALRAHRQCPRSPSRTAPDPTASLESGQERKPFGHALRPLLPLVALRLERAHLDQDRHRRSRTHRHAAAAHRKTTRQQSRPLPACLRPSLRAGRSAPGQPKTPAPVHQSPQIRFLFC
jgi:hypothetical protein